jgi:DNA-binding GntR family transcriptional regulator
VRLGNSVLALDGDQTSVAEAIRIRDALDALLIEDALWHASPADIAEMREILADMAAAVRQLDVVGFVHANWSLHARVAAVSPHAMLRSMYVNLLDHIESHTLAFLPYGTQPIPEVLAERYALHAAIIDAIEARDRDRALHLVGLHNTPGTPGATPGG